MRITIHKTYQNNWTQERGHFRRCTKPSQGNRQHHDEVCTTECIFHEANQSLQDVIKTKDMGEMTVVQGLLDVENSKMEAAGKNLEACRNKKELVDTKRRNVTDNIVASVLTKNK